MQQKTAEGNRRQRAQQKQAHQTRTQRRQAHPKQAQQNQAHQEQAPQKLVQHARTLQEPAAGQHIVGSSQ